MPEYLRADVQIQIFERLATEDIPTDKFDDKGNIVGKFTELERLNMRVDLEGKKHFVVHAVCEGMQKIYVSANVDDNPDERTCSLSHVMHLISSGLVKTFTK